MSSSFIRVDREFFENLFWEEQRTFSYAEAWLDCLRQAAYRPYTRLIGRQAVDIPVGAFAAAERFLAERWGWSRGKVRDFLTVLEREGMITRQTTAICTLIFLRNYPGEDSRAPEKKPAPRPAPDREKPKVVEEKEKKALSHARRAPALDEVLKAASRLGVDATAARRYFFSRQKLAGSEPGAWRDRHRNEILDWESDLQGFAITWEENLRGRERSGGSRSRDRNSCETFRGQISRFGF